VSYTVIDCEQLSPEWFAEHIARLTASHAAEMLARPVKKGVTETTGHADLRVRLAIELVTGQPLEAPEFVSPWMTRGLKLEAEGRGAFESVSGELLQTVGFIRHDTLPIGCSPDAIIGDFEGGLELKCPKHTTHLEYLRLKGAAPAEYLPQITFSLLVTGLAYWDFASYHPAFSGAARLYRARIAREDVDLAGMELAFTLFWSEVEKTAEELRTLSAA
jgi:hypothetical protein